MYYRAKTALWVCASAALFGFAGSSAGADEVKDHFDHGVALYKAHKSSAALDEFQAAQKLAPDDPAILYWLGFINLQQRHYVDAVDPLEKAVKINPASAEAHLNLGNVYDGLKRYPEAVREFQTVARLQPGSADPFFNMGGVYFKMRQPEDAIAAYREAARLAPADPEIQNSLGYVLQSHGNYDASVAAYEKAIKLSPTVPTYYVNLGIVLQDWARKAPPTVKGRPNPDIADIRSYALQTLAQGARANPESYAVREAYAEALYDQNRTAEAVTQFEKAAQLDPSQFDPQYNLGLAQAKTGSASLAAESFARALRINPASTSALRQLGLADYKAAHYKEATDAFTRLTKSDPTAGPAWLDLSSSLEHGGDPAAALAALEQGIKSVTNPGQIALMQIAAGGLCYRYGEAGYDRAIEHYQQALQIAPESPAALNGLGLVAQKRKQTDAALGYFKRAVTADPRFSDAYNNLGVSYQAKGSNDLALASYRRAVQADPTNRLARRNLARIAGPGQSAP